MSANNVGPQKLAASNSNTKTSSSKFWKNFKGDRSDQFLGNRHLGPNGPYDEYGDWNASHNQDYNMSNEYNSMGYTPSESTRYNPQMITGTINDRNGPPPQEDPRERNTPMDQSPYRSDGRSDAISKDYDPDRKLPKKLLANMYQQQNIARFSMRKYATPYYPDQSRYIYGDYSENVNTYKDRPDGVDFRKGDPYKTEKRYINGALQTDVTKDGSMNYNAPQAYMDATGVGLRVIQTDRVRRDIGDSSNISLGFGTDFSTAPVGEYSEPTVGKTFY
jgi:hypothetical protein